MFLAAWFVLIVAAPPQRREEPERPLLQRPKDLLEHGYDFMACVVELTSDLGRMEGMYLVVVVIVVVVLIKRKAAISTGKSASIIFKLCYSHAICKSFLKYAFTNYVIFSHARRGLNLFCFHRLFR